jgi:UDP-glucose 4-epimerase
MKVLIIGSKGFIGSHFAEFFKEKEKDEVHEVDIFDIDEPNYYRISSKNADFDTIFGKIQFDICINCSGAASVQNSIADPLLDFNLNSLNVYKILDSIKRHQLNCRFLNLSSAAVYGNPSKIPTNEQAPCLPLSPYGSNKLMSENICSDFYKYFGVPTCSIRIFSAYGEGLKKQLFWDVAQKANAGNTVQLFGNGNESRDFIFVTDLVHATACIIENAHFQGEAINVANGKEFFIKDVVEIFLQNFRAKKKLQFLGAERTGDPINWCADISVLQSFGYEPKFQIKEGLARYFQWLKKINVVDND